MTEWPSKHLGDLINVKHGFAFKGEYFSSEGDKLVLKPGNFPIGGGLRLRPGKDDYYTGSYPSEFELSPGDLLVVMTDLTQSAPILGSPAFVPEQPAMLHNQRLGLVTVKPDADLDERFLYYVLLSDTTRRQIRATATGATVRHTAPERFYNVSVAVPEIQVQQVIGAILRTIDDLIEVNRRRIEVLHEIALAVHREWFVRFRFPGHERVALIESDGGTVPEGWESVPLGQIAELTMGQSPSSEHYNVAGVGMPFHQGVTDFGDHLPITRKWCSAPGRVAREGDVLVSVRAPVGRINIADVDLTIGRGLAAVRAKDGRQALLLGHLRHAFAIEDSMGGGTIYKAIGKQDLAGVRVLKASERVAMDAEATFGPNLATIRSLTQSNRHLRAIRDLLLPKLVTGQIDVSSLDVDALVEAPVA
ncbi:MAG TPA: restriction endonuclease subunit S [Mycobacteriales bacterium]|nr:restriction endonuclease subunit S [Mycobacteriales bacterium]